MGKGGHNDVEMKGWMEKVHYDVQIKRAGWIREGIMMWKRKGGWKRGQYDVQIKRRMDKEEHYDVEMKGGMQKRGIIMCNQKADE